MLFFGGGGDGVTVDHNNISVKINTKQEYELHKKLRKCCQSFHHFILQTLMYFMANENVYSSVNIVTSSYVTLKTHFILFLA
jgi:Holliday junction resolvasome RuvABC endonuclease subunit